MTDTQTFDQFFATFIVRFAKGKYPNQRLGQAFTDALYFAGKHMIANAFIVSTFDPFDRDDIPAEAIDFARRWW